jgi:predicted RNase H-like HicB family nuclease
MGNAMERTDYTVIYERAEDGGFYAHIPALEITTEGETLDEAQEMARDAIENTLACLRELKQPFPEEVRSEKIEVEA